MSQHMFITHITKVQNLKNIYLKQYTSLLLSCKRLQQTVNFRIFPLLMKIIHNGCFLTEVYRFCQPLCVYFFNYYIAKRVGNISSRVTVLSGNFKVFKSRVVVLNVLKVFKLSLFFMVGVFRQIINSFQLPRLGNGQVNYFSWKSHDLFFLFRPAGIIT